MSSKNLILFLILNLAFVKVDGQDYPTYLKENAIKIDKVDSLNKNIYDLLAAYKIIMIGEIHGTNEPVNFLEGLVKLFTENGDTVQVGFEIPAKQMTPFLKQKTKGSLLKTEFFTLPSGDGRASKAWYKALANFSKNPKVSVFFFDMYTDDSRNADSVMYLNIKSKIKEHPNWKTLTICGNNHNSLEMYNEQNTMGTFLSMDKELNIVESICSLNHQFKGGQTLWNEFKETETIYSKLGYDNYLFLYPKNRNEPYTGIFYTKYLTKSDAAISK